MTLETIYSIGQTIAVFAILASLFAIWLQMRQSQKIERAAAQRDLLSRVSDWSRHISTAGKGSDDFLQGLLEYEKSEAAVQMQVNTALGELVFICESALNMRNNGFFSDGTWAGIEGATIAIIRTPGGSQWWQYGQNFIGFEIVQHLKKRLAETDSDAPTFLDILPTFRKRLQEIAKEA